MPFLAVLASVCIWFSGCGAMGQSGSGRIGGADGPTDIYTAPAQGSSSAGQEDISLDEVPEYAGEPYVEINNNEPDFSGEDLVEESYEYYGELDDLGRCSVAVADIGSDLMPTEERGQISQVKPTGWQTAKYDSVEGKYLYNRCHLIGYQLTAENANENNLITGTRYMNVEGMLPFENMVAEYIEETNNHVLYRVTPIFEGDNLLASGVQMEAESVEDEGEGICYNVYVYNVQPGIEIDYATGESRESTDISSGENTKGAETSYVLNKNTMKFHKPDCSGVSDIKSENRENFTGSRSELISEGYAPCGRCKP